MARAEKTGKSGAKSGRAQARRASEGTALPFDIEASDLPDAIEEAALASGDYPYDAKMDDDEYEEKLRDLQIELLRMQDWIRTNGERLVVVFEGRDGAGKGGTIARFTQHLIPRHARVVALSKPTDAERGQWYFQRYLAHLPTRGDILILDRSWYNRAGVERVMGFCTEAETERFLQEAPDVERMLVADGIRVVKLFLTIGREMQLKRLHKRYHDPLKRWKLSPIDFQASEKWDAYSAAFEAMLARTDSAHAPWTVLRANDKSRLRLNAIRHVLRRVPYEGRDEDRIGEIDDRIVLTAGAFLDRGGEV